MQHFKKNNVYPNEKETAFTNFNNLKLNIKYQDNSIKQVTNFKIL